MSFMDPNGHILTLWTYNSAKELKLRTEIQIIIKLGFRVKNATFSSQESGMSFMDPKFHI